MLSFGIKPPPKSDDVCSVVIVEQARVEIGWRSHIAKSHAKSSSVGPRHACGCCAQSAEDIFRDTSSSPNHRRPVWDPEGIRGTRVSLFFVFSVPNPDIDAGDR